MATTGGAATRAGKGDVPVVEVSGVRLSHPEKLLWPRDGISKLELARYYERIAPTMLPYVQDRPLALRPFPRGVDQPGFYLKDAPAGAPDWLATFTATAESTGQPVDFVVARDARTLVWLAQRNAVEVHTWLSRTDAPERPDWAVMDLDPGDETPWEWVARGARAVRDLLDGLGLRSFAKLSGSSGVHVLVPLARVHTFDRVREFFERVGQQLVEAHGDILTLDYATRARGRRVLLDYAQNAYARNTVAPYSARPKPGAPVAMPVRWEELDDPRLRPNRWTIRTAFDRLSQVGDLLAPARELDQRLPARG